MVGLCPAAALWALTLVFGLPVAIGGGRPAADRLELDQPRVVVLKSKRLLHLFDGDRLVRSYPMALGPRPVGEKQRLGDGRTPLGQFRICTKNRRSEHHRFLGIDYPQAQHARRGLADGLLTTGQAEAILAAAAEGRCPPWTTPLGGAVGLHGGDPRPAGAPRDWTAGCIALTDDRIDELYDVLRLGDPVEILP
ncbi:MAG: murein L,D-transpeptidase [bacterium]|nr:murein L,D-transpeptidase [bacterium]